MSSATFSNVFIGHQYQISAVAYSKGGESEREIFNQQWVDVARVPLTTHNNWTTTTLIITIICAFSFLSLIIAGAVFMCRHYAKKERTEKRCQYFQELEEKTPQYIDTLNETFQIDPNDKWEIPSERLSLGTTVGQGAFGVVRKGWLKMEDGNHQEVAVKTLQECSSFEEKRQLLQEIEIMKSVGPHKNLVSMVGCIIKPNMAPLLVVEFCSMGDLKSYLQNAWESITNENIEVHYAELMNADDPEAIKHFANKTYYLQNENSLLPQDLLSFSRQIAIGMEYLSSLHVLHRDLAARNVLVCEDKTVKVSDFGLSRDVYRDNVYYKSGSGRLPVRWMALESLTHQVYTTQSDIWSFGVLLWEIVTLGGNPYPGVPTQDLPKFLEAGHRMEKPPNCSNDLYNLMLSCWKKNPKERPTFADVKNYLDKLLENVSDYLQIEACKEISSGRETKYPKNKKTNSSERYVKPINVLR